MAKGAYIGVDDGREHAVAESDIPSDFWDEGEYEPYGGAPAYDTQTGRYAFDFAVTQPEQIRDFKQEALNGTLPVAANSVYYITQNYPNYAAEAIYMKSGDTYDLEMVVVRRRGGVAGKVKKGYIGVQTDVPIYSEETKTVSITASNIAEYFEVTNGSYYFAGSGSTFTSNNGGVKSSTASTVLKAKQDISSLSFSYSYSSEKSYDKFTLKVAGTAVENAVSGPTTSKTYSGSLTAGQTVEFIYAKDSSNDSNDDECTFSAMSITATVRTQTGAEAKEVARKLKKAYIGIGNVARPCWSGGELAYYGEITPLSSSRKYRGGASIGGHALYLGGFVSTNDEGCTTVRAYDASLVQSTPTQLSVSRGRVNSANAGNYAIISGAEAYDTISTNDVYNEDLTRSTIDMGATYQEAVGSITPWGAVFFLDNGGNDYGGQCFDSDLTRTPFTIASPSVTYGCDYPNATNTKNHAMVAGSYGDNLVWAVDENLTATGLHNLSGGNRQNPQAASFLGKAIFAGGYDSTGSSTKNYDNVDCYDDDLTRTTLTVLSYCTGRNGAQGCDGVSLDNHVIFPGASGGDVDVYDSDFVRSVMDVNLYEGKCVRVGDYALLAENYGKNVCAFVEV